MTPEELQVLTYLRQRTSATPADVARACLPAAGPDWLRRVLGGLDWLGYVAVYYGPGGEPTALQLTDKGAAHLRAIVSPGLP
jgi:hypothetical protein